MLRRYPAGGATGPAVLFVKADWCPHCRTAKPELQHAASVLGSVVPVYEVDSERDKAVIAGLRVGGFPTILFLTPAGRTRTYSGERKGQRIADWACTQSGRCGGRR